MHSLTACVYPKHCLWILVFETIVKWYMCVCCLCTIYILCVCFRNTCMIDIHRNSHSPVHSITPHTSHTPPTHTPPTHTLRTHHPHHTDLSDANNQTAYQEGSGSGKLYYSEVTYMHGYVMCCLKERTIWSLSKCHLFLIPIIMCVYRIL